MAKLRSVRALCLSLLFPAIASAASLDDYYLSKFGQQAQLAKALESVVGLQGQHAERCRTDLYRSLKRDFTSLQPATQKTLAKYVGRPTLSGQTSPTSSPSYSSAHFTVHYTTTGADAPDLTDADADGVPDHVERVAAVFEEVYAAEVTTMGYRPPPVSSRYDVYLLDLIPQGAYGFTSDDGAPTAPNLSVGSSIEIDKAFTDPMFTVNGLYTPDQMLQITAAHEFNHAIQFGYNYYFDIWYGEATSTWMEDQVYDSVNQCYSYLTDYVPLAATISLNAGLNGGSEYGRWIFNRFLTEMHDTQTTSVVRSIWEKLGTLSPSSNPKTAAGDVQMPPVINSVLVGSYGSSLATDFVGFAQRVYARSWSSHPADLNRIPAATIAASYSSYPVPSQVVTMPHYTFAFHRFVPSAGVADLTLTVAKTSGAQVAVLKRSGGTVSEIAANSGGTSYTITGFGSLNPATDEVVLVVANTTDVDNHQVSFSTDGTPSTPTEPKVSSGGGGGGGGCFIATAAYGSYLHPKVAELRAFRDRYLMTNAPGRLFVSAYYRLSPPIADVISRHGWMRSGVRCLLLPLIFAVEHPAAALALLLLVLAASLRWGVLYLKGRAREAAAA
ncbi:MXAN_6640 family putative metalloprotease [Geomonas diazotrophica]|uniref:MXAN_6640 family putative metalloprotease n=1 Tax=Geomonas diazotrophica TaxID=2843197 RepID=UPI001F48B1C3|nr:MXAN_6640 family putative metalloprotease [Geomonas diazotrophica]